MALGGVEESGVDDAVGHGAYADVGGGVDADDANVAASLGARGLRRSDGHAVVVGIDELRVGIEVQERVGRALGFFFLPVGRRAGKDCAALCLELGGKAFVAVLGGGGAWQSVYLYDLAARPDEMLRVARCGASQSHVVHADAGGVGVAVDVAVEDNDGRASLVDFLDDGREGSGLVGRNDEYVAGLLHEATDIGYLLLAAVVGGADFHGGIVVEEYLAVDFIVHLHALVVLAALGNADPVFFLFFATCQQGGEGKEHEEGKEAAHGLYRNRLNVCARRVQRPSLLGLCRAAAKGACK